MLATIVAIASPAPVAANACGTPTASVAGVYGTPVLDRAILRFVRLLAIADPSLRRAAMDAARKPADSATATAVNAGIDSMPPCSATSAAVAAQRMGDAVSESWGVEDVAAADRLGERLLLIARALTARNSVEGARIDALIAPYGVSLATLTAPEPPPAEPCTSSDARAHTTHLVQPDYPAIARATSTTGTVLLKVELDADGNVVSVTLYQGTGATGPGPGALVDSAMLAAGTTSYEAETHACRGVSGAYLFAASFTNRP